MGDHFFNPIKPATRPAQEKAKQEFTDLLRTDPKFKQLADLITGGQKLGVQVKGPPEVELATNIIIKYIGLMDLDFNGNAYLPNI